MELYCMWPLDSVFFHLTCVLSFFIFSLLLALLLVFWCHIHIFFKTEV